MTRGDMSHTSKDRALKKSACQALHTAHVGRCLLVGKYSRRLSQQQNAPILMPHKRKQQPSPTRHVQLPRQVSATFGSRGHTGHRLLQYSQGSLGTSTSDGEVQLSHCVTMGEIISSRHRGGTGNHGVPHTHSSLVSQKCTYTPTHSHLTHLVRLPPVGLPPRDPQMSSHFSASWPGPICHVCGQDFRKSKDIFRALLSHLSLAN